MTFEIRERRSPLTAPDHLPSTMDLIGTVKEDDMARFEELCRAVPPPKPQVWLTGKANSPSKPPRTCGQWVRETVVRLKDEGVLVVKGGSEDLHEDV